jgi:putative hydrolase of the HAD superfamily
MKKTIRIILAITSMVLLMITIIFTNDNVDAQFHTKQWMPIIAFLCILNVAIVAVWVWRTNYRKNIKYIIFDIDGVLAQATDSVDEILEKNQLTIEEFFDNWGDSKSVHQFETGQISQEVFSRLRSEELVNTILPKTIIEILSARKSSLFPGVEQLLLKLQKANYKMACLSNTNILHWSNIEGKTIFDRYFCRQFLSFELGMLKPDQEIYQHVMMTLHCKGHEILYFDDSKKNIEAALLLDWQAVQVQDFDDLLMKINNIIEFK